MEHEHFFTIIALVIAALVGSGGVGVVLKFGTRMKLQEESSKRHEEELKELTLLNVSSRLSTLESAVKEIKESLGTLNTLPALVDKIDFMVRAVEKMMPRAEIELRFENQDLKIDNIKEKVDGKQS